MLKITDEKCIQYDERKWAPQIFNGFDCGYIGQVVARCNFMSNVELGHRQLTTREMETVMLIARGLVTKEIARSLTVSEKTVRNYFSGIYRKLGVYDRSQVVIYALKHGLVDLHEL
jgi:DNA-binding NarL/FixJ family response regulator